MSQDKDQSISYAQKALEEYKAKLIEIYPDAFNPDKNDYRGKVDAIKKLEAKQMIAQDQCTISQIQHKLDQQLGNIDFQLKVYNQQNGTK